MFVCVCSYVCVCSCVCMSVGGFVSISARRWERDYEGTDREREDETGGESTLARVREKEVACSNSCVYVSCDWCGCVREVNLLELSRPLRNLQDLEPSHVHTRCHSPSFLHSVCVLPLSPPALRGGRIRVAALPTCLLISCSLQRMRCARSGGVHYCV